MARPAETVVVIDAAGVPRQVHPVDAREIVANGGSWEVSEKQMLEATTRDDGHPVGQSGMETIETVTHKPLKNVEAKSGEAAKNDPDTFAAQKAGEEAPHSKKK